MDRSKLDVRDRTVACELDRADPLTAFRSRFYLPTNQIYLDGNSLGLLSRDAEAAVLAAIEQWKTLAIEGWTADSSRWFFLAEELGRLTAPLIGAAPESVIVANSTTVNLHQLLATVFGTQTAPRVAREL